jgi:hypothetical protein
VVCDCRKFEKHGFKVISLGATGPSQLAQATVGRSSFFQAALISVLNTTYVILNAESLFVRGISYSTKMDLFFVLLRHKLSFGNIKHQQEGGLQFDTL